MNTNTLQGTLVPSMITDDTLIVWRCRHCARCNLLARDNCQSCGGHYLRSVAVWRVWTLPRWLDYALGPLFAPKVEA
jgi:hypothetical protein